jgi:hypothetical protein
MRSWDSIHKGTSWNVGKELIILYQSWTEEFGFLFFIPKSNNIGFRVFGEACTLEEDVCTTSKRGDVNTVGSFVLEESTLSLLECLLSITNTVKVTTSFTAGSGYT